MRCGQRESVKEVKPGMTPMPLPTRSHHPLALTHVTVVRLDGGPQLRDHTVVVDRSIIARVAPAARVDTTAMDVVDGCGLYVLPGLADMHVHLWHPGDMALFLAHGVTTVRNMSGVPLHLALQAAVRRGDLPGPRIFTTGPIIEGISHAHPLWSVVSRPEQAEPVVTAHLARGYQQIKVYNRVTRESLEAIGRAAGRCGLRVVGHCPDGVAFEEAMAAGMSCFEHLKGIGTGHCLPGTVIPPANAVDARVVAAEAHALDFDAIRRLASAMAACGAWNCPTLVCLHQMHRPHHEGMADASLAGVLPRVPSMALGVWEALDGFAEQGFARRGESRAEWLSMWARRCTALRRVVRILAEEGAPLLAGTDVSVRFTFPGFSLHQEIALLSASGLGPLRALRAATSDAARFLGEEGLWGAVAAGQRADLVMTRADPLADPAALGQIEAVLAGGHYLDRRALDALLEHARRLAAAPLPEPELAMSADGASSVGVHGVLVRRAFGGTGTLAYRHTPLPSGGWLVEECETCERGDIFSIGGVQRRVSRVVIGADLSIREASRTTETFAGTERVDVRRNDADYTVHSEAVDGYSSSVALSCGPLVADTSLAATGAALPDAHSAGEVKALALDLDTPRAITLTLQRDATDGSTVIHRLGTAERYVVDERAHLVRGAGSGWQLTTIGSGATRRS